MDIEKVLELTGFQRCEFEPDVDPCEKCGKEQRQLFYQRTDYWENEGQYFCAECVTKLAEEIDTLIEIECATCGDEFTGWPHEKGSECFDCFAARASLPS